MTRQCMSIHGCDAPAVWHLADLFGNDPDTYLCDPHLGTLGGMANAQRRGWDVRPVKGSPYLNANHAAAVERKAARAVTAARHLIARPNFPERTGDPGTDLEILIGYLFDDPTSAAAAAMWTALGTQARLDQGRRFVSVREGVSAIEDYRTSREAIRAALTEAARAERALADLLEQAGER